MGIVEKGFEKPSPIQEECIPVALAGKDVIARSKNGTGKTAAYIIPILEKINKSLNHVQALVLVPTRELALQTVSVIKQLGKYLEIQVMSSTGGAGFADDVLRLGQVVHILVGTPGRILDLVNKKVADFSKTEILVLDEADKLLSFDFKPIIEDIMRYFKEDRQIMLFSATFPISLKSFKDEHMEFAKEINMMEELTLLGVT